MKIRKLRDLSLNSKMMLVIVLICFTFLVGYYAILQRSYQSYDEQLYINTAQVYTSFVEQMETEFTRINTVTLSMIGNENVQDDLVRISDSDPGAPDWVAAKEDLKTVLHSYQYGANLFSRLYIFSAGGNMIGNRDEALLPEDQQELIELAAQAQGLPQIVLCGNHIYYSRQIRDKNVNRKNALGTMIGRINVQKLMTQGNDIYRNAGIGMHIAVDVGEVRIYSGGEEEILPLKQDGWQIQGNFFVVQCTNARGWKFLLYSPYDEIHKSIRMTQRNSLWLTTFIAVIALLCSYYLVNRSTRHMNTLITKIDAYRNGILPSEQDMARYKNRNDEFGRLHRHFDRMAYDYKKINDENYNYMMLQKEAQFKQLQQQIQPHFIFNTMSLITGIAYEHEDTEIAEISTSMSRLLRASMSFDEKAVEVRAELRLVEDYMLIQSKRFGSRLHYVMEIPEELQGVLIPNLTIQPIVENSVKYALEEMLDPCVIRLTGWREGDTAVLAVEDTGPGIDPDILKKLATSRITAKGNGIGLQNIHTRIRLLFSERYGLNVCRLSPGTQVQIRVPWHGGET